jgi:hypothetical protein
MQAVALVSGLAVASAWHTPAGVGSSSAALLRTQHVRSAQSASRSAVTMAVSELIRISRA